MSMCMMIADAAQHCRIDIILVDHKLRVHLRRGILLISSNTILPVEVYRVFENLDCAIDLTISRASHTCMCIGSFNLSKLNLRISRSRWNCHFAIICCQVQHVGHNIRSVSASMCLYSLLRCHMCGLLRAIT
jgi:hypothetical protein